MLIQTSYSLSETVLLPELLYCSFKLIRFSCECVCWLLISRAPMSRILVLVLLVEHSCPINKLLSSFVKIIIREWELLVRASLPCQPLLYATHFSSFALLGSTGIIGWDGLGITIMEYVGWYRKIMKVLLSRCNTKLVALCLLYIIVHFISFLDICFSRNCQLIFATLPCKLIVFVLMACLFRFVDAIFTCGFWFSFQRCNLLVMHAPSLLSDQSFL